MRRQEMKQLTSKIETFQKCPAFTAKAYSKRTLEQQFQRKATNVDGKTQALI